MTDYLFAHIGFIGGLARSLDLGDTPTGYNENASREEADRLATKSDWLAVGRDMEVALGKFKASQAKAASALKK